MSSLINKISELRYDLVLAQCELVFNIFETQSVLDIKEIGAIRQLDTEFIKVLPITRSIEVIEGRRYITYEFNSITANNILKKIGFADIVAHLNAHGYEVTKSKFIYALALYIQGEKDKEYSLFSQNHNV